MSDDDARTPEKWPLDTVLDFLRLLWTVEHALQRQSKRMEARLGVTGPQRLVLRVVERFPDISPGELAEVVYLHPSTLTGVLRRLVDRRLLVRVGDPGDKRRSRLRVVEQSKLLTKKSAGTVEAAVTRVLSRVSERKIQHTRDVLAALAQELDEGIDG